jgi:division protein CdvB (Snf7/Vps24/ESCRT-III family)
MFQDYTTEELLELRCLCLENIEAVGDVVQRADTLMVLQYIEEELTLRHHTKAA